jgi:NADH-quinone oxidoreductase subunit B
LLKLHEQIGDTKLGSNRKREIIELEKEALLATPVTAQRGLLR